MTAATKNRPALTLAQELLSLVTGGNIRGALARAESGVRKYPDFRVPAKNEGDPTPSFAEIAEWLRGQLPQAAEAPAAEPQTAEPQTAEPAPRKAAAAKKAAPVKTAPVAEPAPVKVPEPVKVETVTLRLIHNGTDPTSIYGVEKGSPAHLAIGAKRNGGLGWFFWAGGPAFYIPKSGGYAPDYKAINLAISRLESITQDGQQLYKVESEIVTEVDGKALPVRMTKAEAAQWQRAYDAARNALGWNLSMTQAVCGKCGATGLGEKTGRIGKGADGLPMVECYTCGGFAAPEPVAVPETVQETALDLSGLLALAAEPAPVPESAECPKCREQFPVVDGKLALHSRRFGGGACRGKLGVTVTDVEPEPVAPVKAARKAAPVKAARKAAPVKAAPVAEPETADESDSAVGMVVKFALQSGLSGTARNATATEVRQALTRKITYGRAFRGVKIETRRDKVNHQLVLTVVEGAEGFDAAELADAIVAAVKSVRGVGNRSHR